MHAACQIGRRNRNKALASGVNGRKLREKTLRRFDNGETGVTLQMIPIAPAALENGFDLTPRNTPPTRKFFANGLDGGMDARND